MRKDTFVIKIVQDGEERVKENNRAAFLHLMQGIKEQFVDNNEFAKKFVEIIPDVDEIEINVTRNQDCDIPFVKCTSDGKSRVIQIPRFHRIIWAILLESAK